MALTLFKYHLNSKKIEFFVLKMNFIFLIILLGQIRLYLGENKDCNLENKSVLISFVDEADDFSINFQTKNLTTVKCKNLKSFRQFFYSSTLVSAELDFGILSNFTLTINSNNLPFLDWTNGKNIFIKNVHNIILIKPTVLTFQQKEILFNNIIFSDLNLNNLFNYWPFKFNGNNFYLTNSILYSSNLSPSLFNNSNILNFYISDLTLENTLKFNSSNETIYSMIKNLIIDKSEFDLNNQLINKNVFSYLNSLTILNSNLICINETTFSDFYYLKHVNLSLNNFTQFIQNSNNTWFKSLNSYFEIDFNNCLVVKLLINFDITYLILNDQSKLYEFPDKDFCLFKFFSNRNFVFPIIQTKENLSCTCTLVWLLLNWKYEMLAKNTTYSKMNTSSVSDCFKNFDDWVDKCNFDLRLKNCRNIPSNQGYYYQCDNETKNYSKKCISQFIELILIIFITILGIILNLLSFYVISEIKSNLSMYKYMAMEIFFQLVSLILFSFSSVFNNNFSIENYNNIKSSHCALDFRLVDFEFTIFFVTFISPIGGVAITANNLAHFFMTLDRYLEIKNSKHLKWFYKPKKMYKKVFFFILIISILMNFNLDLNSFNLSNKLIQILNYFFLIQDLVAVLITISSFVINIFLVKFMIHLAKRKKSLLNTHITKSEDSYRRTLVSIIFSVL